jgi:uncharacterized protein (DUF4415 family)
MTVLKLSELSLQDAPKSTKENDMSNDVVTFEFDPAHPPKLNDAQREELARLAAMPDEDIDFSDIPPLTEKFWTNAVRGKFYRPVKKQVTLRLDADLIDWFKTNQGGTRGYQTAINAALRKVVEGERGKG